MCHECVEERGGQLAIDNLELTPSPEMLKRIEEEKVKILEDIYALKHSHGSKKTSAAKTVAPSQCTTCNINYAVYVQGFGVTSPNMCRYCLFKKHGSEQEVFNIDELDTPGAIEPGMIANTLPVGSSYGMIGMVIESCINRMMGSSVEISEIDDGKELPLLNKLLSASITFPEGKVTIFFRRHLENPAIETAHIKVLICSEGDGSIVEAELRIPQEDRISDVRKPECIREMNRILAVAQAVIAK
jgi:hypothetical protein